MGRGRTVCSTSLSIQARQPTTRFQRFFRHSMSNTSIKSGRERWNVARQIRKVPSRPHARCLRPSASTYWTPAVPYGDDADLPKLYRLTAEELNLAPSQQREPIFKQVFGGCQTVVEGLGALRNKLSDAHGRGKTPSKPEPRHAELAVNLAGAMATYLVETFAGQNADS